MTTAARVPATTLSPQGEAALVHAAASRPVLPLWWPVDGHCACSNPSCDNVGKHPYGRLAPHGAYSATTDLEQVRRWWQLAPKANIGWAQGVRSGSFVLDVDPRHGGDETLRELEARYGPLPQTPHALTGGGGEHIIFKQPDVPLPNAVAFAAGLDVRTDGGLVVAAGSVHASGRVYTWDAGAHPDDVPLADAPDWLLAIIQTAAREQKEHNRLTMADVLDGVAEGERGDAIFRAAAKLRAADVPYAWAHQLVLSSASNCTPPLPEAEAIKHLDSAYQRYEPGTLAVRVTARWDDEDKSDDPADEEWHNPQDVERIAALERDVARLSSQLADTKAEKREAERTLKLKRALRRNQGLNGERHTADALADYWEDAEHKGRITDAPRLLPDGYTLPQGFTRVYIEGTGDEPQEGSLAFEAGAKGKKVSTDLYRFAPTGIIDHYVCSYKAEVGGQRRRLTEHYVRLPDGANGLRQDAARLDLHIPRGAAAHKPCPHCGSENTHRVNARKCDDCRRVFTDGDEPTQEAMDLPVRVTSRSTDPNEDLDFKIAGSNTLYARQNEIQVSQLPARSLPVSIAVPSGIDHRDVIAYQRGVAVGQNPKSPTFLPLPPNQEAPWWLSDCWYCEGKSLQVPAVGVSESGRPACERHKRE